MEKKLSLGILSRPSSFPNSSKCIALGFSHDSWGRHPKCTFDRHSLVRLPFCWGILGELAGTAEDKAVLSTI